MADSLTTPSQRAQAPQIERALTGQTFADSFSSDAQDRLPNSREGGASSRSLYAAGFYSKGLRAHAASLFSVRVSANPNQP